MSAHMVSGWDKHRPDYTPPREPLPTRVWMVVWLVFFASITVGMGIGSLVKYGKLWPWQ